MRLWEGHVVNVHRNNYFIYQSYDITTIALLPGGSDSGPQGSSRGAPRPPAEEDVNVSDHKVDRATRLRRISADRNFRSRHLNAIADRKLQQETQVMERKVSAGSKSHEKQRETIRKELFSMQREKSMSVDDYLGQVRERSTNKRKNSKGSREKQSTSLIKSVDEKKGGPIEDETAAGPRKSSLSQRNKQTL